MLGVRRCCPHETLAAPDMGPTYANMCDRCIATDPHTLHLPYLTEQVQYSSAKHAGQSKVI